MGLFSFAVAAGIGAAAVKVSERVKAAKPDSKPTVDDYIGEAKAYAGELSDKAKDFAPVVVDKAEEVVQKAKDALNR